MFLEIVILGNNILSGRHVGNCMYLIVLKSYGNFFFSLRRLVVSKDAILNLHYTQVYSSFIQNMGIGQYSQCGLTYLMFTNAAQALVLNAFSCLQLQLLL